MQRRIKTRFLLAILATVIGAWFFAPLKPVSAATLYLKASAATVGVGDSFSVKVYVNTQGKSINSAEANMLFPDNLVEATSISSAGSIFSLWVEQPSFDNSSGQANFSGGVPNPGYNGSGGQVISIVFKAKSAGTANFSLTGAAVRENDGLGTDILGGVAPAVVIVGSQAEAATPAAETGKLSRPVITSAAYPDQNSWYSARSGSVSFKYPAGASAIQTLIGNNPNSAPTVTIRPAVVSRDLSNLADGVWYFHLRYQSGGQWSDTANYRIQIDGTAPKNLAVDVVTTTSGLGLSLKAEDPNLDHFELSLDGDAPQPITLDQAKGTIILTNLTSGLHVAKAVAFDKAGNSAEMIRQINIPQSAAPVINALTSSIRLGDKFLLAGSSTPNSNVKVELKLQNGSEYYYDTVADSLGNFVVSSGPIAFTGSHTVKAFAYDAAGALSPESDTKALQVAAQPSLVATLPPLLATWQQALSLLSWIILLSFLLFGWYKYLVTKRKLTAVRRHADQAFIMLVDRAKNQVAVLDKLAAKRKSTRSEILAIKDINDVLDKIKDMKENGD